MDLSEKESDSEIARSGITDGLEEAPSNDDLIKSCADCGTTKTPLWRGGPAGPKSLCNACGIRSRKKRRAVVGLNRGGSDRKLVKGPNSKPNSIRLGDSINRRRMLAPGSDVLLQRSPRTTVMMMEKQRKQVGEEEQAAVLLMALSYGSVYA